MDLTKHQYLEKAIRQMFDRLNEFYAQLTQTLSTGQVPTSLR